MSDKKCTRLKTNLLRQDCYVRECFGADDLRSHVASVSTYPVLEQVVEQGGVREIISERPYPVTPESVNSFADSCDYKMDPVGCQISGRKNLGDIRATQELLSMDSATLVSEQSALRARLVAVQEALKAKSAPAPVTDDRSSEVPNNG